MVKENWDTFISKFKEYYYSIGSIPCPAFNNEPIYFTQDGFRHLLIKNGRYRTKSAQFRKLKLVHFAPNILSSARRFDSVRTVGTDIKLWSFVRKSNSKLILVVVRQIGSGKKHFLSIMDK